jgi:hypothetical protein
LHYRSKLILPTGFQSVSTSIAIIVWWMFINTALQKYRLQRFQHSFWKFSNFIEMQQVTYIRNYGINVYIVISTTTVCIILSYDELTINQYVGIIKRNSCISSFLSNWIFHMRCFCKSISILLFWDLSRNKGLYSPTTNESRWYFDQKLFCSIFLPICQSDFF